VLVVEMKADYVGGPIRPVERWVSREEHDKIERLRRLGEVPPVPRRPPSAAELHAVQEMERAMATVHAGGLYSDWPVASYDREV
jgi:hypothetical protein